MANGAIWWMWFSTRTSSMSREDSISLAKPLPMWVTKLPTISYNDKTALNHHVVKCLVPGSKKIENFHILRTYCIKASHEKIHKLFFLSFFPLGWLRMQRLVLLSTVSAETSYSVARCTFTPDVCKLSMNGWCVTLSETGVSCVGETLMLYVYSAQPWLFSFSRRWPSVHHAHSCRAAQGPAHPSQQGCIAATGAYRAWHGAHGLTPFSSVVSTHYNFRWIHKLNCRKNFIHSLSCFLIQKAQPQTSS